MKTARQIQQKITKLTKGIFFVSFVAFCLKSEAQISPTNAVANLTTNAQQRTALDNAIAALGLSITNWSVDPYATYAPSAPGGSSKFGGGLFACYDFNSYAGAGLGLDWLGQFSLVSGDIQLKAPFHLATLFPSLSSASWYQNFEIVPFVIGGVATPYSGNGHFNGTAMVVSDVGGYFEFGNLWGCKFNAGLCWGKWIGQGPYAITRYHAFFGLSKGF